MVQEVAVKREIEAGLGHARTGKLSLNPAVNGYLFMPPTSKKLRGHIGLGLSVRLSVRNTFWHLRNSRTALC